MGQTKRQMPAQKNGSGRSGNEDTNDGRVRGGRGDVTTPVKQRVGTKREGPCREEPLVQVDRVWPRGRRQAAASVVWGGGGGVEFAAVGSGRGWPSRHVTASVRQPSSYHTSVDRELTLDERE